MNNLAQLIDDRAARYPRARLGLAENSLALIDAAGIARRCAAKFLAAGLRRGDRMALVGQTRNSYLLAWMAAQFAGLELALVNPTLPQELLRQMLEQLAPAAVCWVGLPIIRDISPGAHQLDATHAAEEVLLQDDRPLEANETPLPGYLLGDEEIAGYMHTSGTTGLPKFCAQSQRYFLRLGQLVADKMGISPQDTVYAPLPMFHINPLGYGVVGGLTGGASVLAAERFSASRFWAIVREQHVTVAFLHAPPVEILKKATSRQAAAGHSLRCVFYADEDFLNQFDIPQGFSCYGSTEAAGLTHLWAWQQGEHCPQVEGMSHYAGEPRADIEWQLSASGEIWIKGREAGVLSSGYRTHAGLAALPGADGWFHTGDLGRADEHGRLIFIERQSESIRVKGEFVPIEFVERSLADAGLPAEIAIWRRSSALVDHEVVLYAATPAPLSASELVDQLAQRAFALPAFMRPVMVYRVAALPRGQGVGKLLRRGLEQMPILESVAMEPIYQKLRAEQVSNA